MSVGGCGCLYGARFINARYDLNQNTKRGYILDDSIIKHVKDYNISGSLVYESCV